MVAAQRDTEIHVAELALLDVDALLAGIDQQRSRNRLRTADSDRLGEAEASTTVPPETLSPQAPPLSRGASSWREQA